jgi:RND family efflux transporter MFP subunit
MNFMKINRQQIATALFLASSVFLASCSSDHHENGEKNETPVSVTIASAGRQWNNTIHASGQIESEQTAVISTRVMGYITRIDVKAGDHVQKGQLLATISSDDIQAKKAQAQAMVAESEAALKDAQRDYERFAALFNQQSASEKEFENATLHYNSVKAKTEAARQMQKEAESMLAYTNLRAPFAGVITQKNLNAGSMANPGMPILILEHTGGYKAKVTVSESDIASVKEGADADVVIKSSGRVIKGKVAEVSPSSQFSGGQYVISVRIPDAEKNGLYPGMSVNVTLSSSAKTNEMDAVVLVPASSLVLRDQLTGLYTVSESGTALLRWVKLGRAYGKDVEVLSGLSQDEKFILNSESKLYNGAPVKVKESVAERK